MIIIVIIIIRYKLSKPISTRVTDLLYIDDLKVFAASESKLNRVLELTQATMEDIGLQWNPMRSCPYKERGPFPTEFWERYCWK